MATDDSPPSAYPLAGWADRQVATFREMTKAPALHDLCGAGLLVERAAFNRFRVPGMVSAGGGCRMLATRDGWVALNLARDDDRSLLPALFCDDFDQTADQEIAGHMAQTDSAAIVARGREMGLAIASVTETPASAPCTILTEGTDHGSRSRAPLVIDLSALWAGPLAGHLLWLAGADVVKVESRTRPDAMRDGDPGLFALLNQGKANVALDLRDGQDLEALLALIARADIVIEAARPRALRQLGIDAEALVRSVPGLVWITITGHGATGDAADWIGFGDDCGVAGGLSAALLSATGSPGFVGDAIADPLTGIMAATIAWSRWTSGRGGRIALSMSAIVHRALAEQHRDDPAKLQASLRQWSASTGHPITDRPARIPAAILSPLGADNAAWLPC